jgi:NAD(P)-dependent dehydrogenase (short-subunit alcohol dehydrogenase family)
MTRMQPWIEQNGGPAAAAAAIAPAIRGIFGRGGPLRVRFAAEESLESYGPGIDGITSARVGEASCEAGLESIYSELCQIAGDGICPAVVELPGLGAFLLETPARRPEKRLDHKICLVTGAAQGFGEGIARELAAAGATLVIADLNEPLAAAVARSIEEEQGMGAAAAFPVDVSQEDSVRNLVEQVVLRYGGLDLLVSNAGVLRAGGLEEMTLKDFEFVTRINYTAFFLVTKYGSRPMKRQARFDAGYFSDIVQVNSKSGLEGSNRNFAYAGGKFGGIGLVQSFAKELVEDRIKVNAVCPGNYYEGPLWSDPAKGLFVQYLASGKVPGARSTKDVYDFYVSKVPMKRGCFPADVAKAIMYCVEQQYETGQAIPVTGGQNMLK